MSAYPGEGVALTGSLTDRDEAATKDCIGLEGADVSHPADNGLDPVTALGTLLTTESLLFAAFSVALSLTDYSNRPRDWLIPGRTLVAIAVGLLFFVAVGSGTAWWQIFIDRGFPR